MSFEEFLAYIREKVGYYCTDGYWYWKYGVYKPQSKEEVDKLLPDLAINAIGTHISLKGQEA